MMLYSFNGICGPNKFEIFCLPIEAEFYIPPTKEYIIQHGVKIEITSSILTTLFKKSHDKKGTKGTSDGLKSLRILITNKNDGKSIFITSERQILRGNKKYNLDKRIITNVLKEIKKYGCH